MGDRKRLELRLISVPMMAGSPPRRFQNPSLKTGPWSPATNMVNDIFTRYIAPNASNRAILLVSRAMVVLLGFWVIAPE